MLETETVYEVVAVKAEANVIVSKFVLTESIVHVAAVPPTRQLGLEE